MPTASPEGPVEAQLPAFAEVRIARANLYLSREVCDACLPGLQAVALLRREGQVLIVPLMAGSAGGLLLKLRNLRGDRVVHAQEFFREHGYAEEFVERRYALRWKVEMAALAIVGLMQANPMASQGVPVSGGREGES